MGNPLKILNRKETLDLRVDVTLSVVRVTYEAQNKRISGSTTDRQIDSHFVKKKRLFMIRFVVLAIETPVALFSESIYSRGNDYDKRGFWTFSAVSFFLSRLKLSCTSFTEITRQISSPPRSAEARNNKKRSSTDLPITFTDRFVCAMIQRQQSDVTFNPGADGFYYRFIGAR